MITLLRNNFLKMGVLVSLLGMNALAYANTTDTTFGDIANQFQQWSEGSFGKLILMVAVGLILGSFMFGGGAKILWSGVGLALIVKYGSSVLSTISGTSAEIVNTNSAFSGTDSLGWDFVFEAFLIIGIAFLFYKNKKLQKELGEHKKKLNIENSSEKK